MARVFGNLYDNPVEEALANTLTLSQALFLLGTLKLEASSSSVKIAHSCTIGLNS